MTAALQLIGSSFTPDIQIKVDVLCNSFRPMYYNFEYIGLRYILSFIIPDSGIF